jgi:hypothetical protein
LFFRQLGKRGHLVFFAVCNTVVYEGARKTVVVKIRAVVTFGVDTVTGSAGLKKLRSAWLQKNRRAEQSLMGWDELSEVPEQAPGPEKTA